MVCRFDCQQCHALAYAENFLQPIALKYKNNKTSIYKNKHVVLLVI